MYKRAPKGYRKAEFPLPHRFNYHTSFSLEDETKNSTIFPILRYSEKAFAPEAQFANPTHGSFAEEVGVTCHSDSIIPRINFKLEVTMSKGAIETDKLRTVRFMWFPIYTSFLEGLDSSDRRTGTTIKAILELETENTNRTTQPIYSGVDLFASSGAWLHPLSNVNDDDEAATTDWGLTTDAELESVAFDYILWSNALRYFSNANMLKTMMGRIHKPLVTRDKPYTYYSNNRTYPKVKRMNPHTFCGIMFHLFQAGEFDQTMDGLDTTVIDHLDVNLQIQYDEWNAEYAQDAY